MTRAAPLPPDDRRRAIVSAALPVLLEHGRVTTTRQLAEAAGVAEGTLFRAFATKEALVDAVLDAVFDPQGLLDALDTVDPELALRDRLVAITVRLQSRFVAIFALMAALGIPAPASRHRDGGQSDWRLRASERMVALVEPDADQLRLPPEEVVRVLRLLTFAGSHPHLTDRHPLTPEEIVDVVLDGARAQRQGSGR